MHAPVIDERFIQTSDEARRVSWIHRVMRGWSDVEREEANILGNIRRKGGRCVTVGWMEIQNQLNGLLLDFHMRWQPKLFKRDKPPNTL